MPNEHATAISEGILGRLPAWAKNCPTCDRMKRNTFTLVAIMVCALGIAVTGTAIYFLIGELRYSDWDLEYYAKLPMLCSLIAFLVWWTWRMDNKMVCNCEVG